MSSEFETIQNLLKMLGFRRIWIDLTWCWRLPPKTKTKKWQLFKNGTKNRPIFLLGKNLKNLEVPYSKGRPSLIYSCQSKSRAEWLKPWGVFRDHFQNPWGPNLEGEQKQSYQLPGLPPPSHPKCKDPKLSPKLIYLSQSHSESSFQAAKKTLSESWEVHVSPIQRVWDRNRLPAWNEPTWQLRPGEKVEILEDFESRSAKKHSNNRSTNTKKTQINTCCWPQEFLEILFFCELCWGSEAFNRQPTTPRPLKEDLIWFHPATAPADETSTGTIRPSMSNPRGESVWSLPSVPTLRGFWHSYSKNMDKEKTYIIYHLLIQWIFNPSTIQDSLRWPHQQFGKEVDTQIDHWRVLPKSKEDVARSSGKKINTRMRMWVYTPEK